MASSEPLRAFLIGHPVAHSRSPLIHGHWLDSFGIDGRYELVDLPPADLPGFCAALPASGFRGGNATIPHKEALFRLVAEATPLARRMGAVNTVWLEDGRLVGDNTDCAGFVAGLDAAFGPAWADEVETALLIGAGGGARAVAASLIERGIRRVVVANRTPGRAEAVALMEPGRIRAIGWEDMAGAFGTTDLLVNTTKLGMTGQPALEIDLRRLPRHAMVSDIVYVPLETPLLDAARTLGLRTADGLGMLLHQAVPGFTRWFGRMPTVTAELRSFVVADLERAA